MRSDNPPVCNFCGIGTVDFKYDLNDLIIFELHNFYINLEDIPRNIEINNKLFLILAIIEYVPPLQMPGIGAGSGADAEGAAPAQTAHKPVKHKRPKTARPRRNRVSPSPVIEAGSPLQPWATAPLSRLSQLIRTSSASTASLNSPASADESDYQGPQRY
ncbi:unnamed protein product [Spodoptera exigua]|nr:unnamed protein product [Spodoptera exigua]